MIPVTKPHLPKKSKYQAYIDRIYKSGSITNNGSLVQELETKLAHYLGVKNLICVANGSLALHLSYKALQLKGEVITTPFSFAATAGTLAWEGLKPIFADINKDSFNLDPKNIEALISKQTSAIVPVHVYGNPCEVEQIDEIANKQNLKVIYDAAHCFNVNYNGQSVLKYGDLSTISFHATKLFHTIEGGAVITEDDKLAKKIRLLINFGIQSSSKVDSIGTNAKMNEFEAAMGLCILDEIDTIKNHRKKIWQVYKEKLSDKLIFQKWNSNSTNNYSYAPILFRNEKKLIEVIEKLNKQSIFPRRYFYPSLDTLNYSNNQNSCAVSRNIASRILCLPIFTEMSIEDAENISLLIKEQV